MMGSLGNSVQFGVPTPGIQAAGVHNTFVIPGELSWKFGDSGFAVKTGLGIFSPDGTVTGLYGTGNIGSPYWTFEPELIVSYLKDGWNLSAALYEELNTKNSISQYTTGDIIHADFTATKTIGKWTFGPSPIITDKLPTTRAVSAVFTERERWRIHKDSTSGRLVVSSGTISDPLNYPCGQHRKFQPRLSIRRLSRRPGQTFLWYRRV